MHDTLQRPSRSEAAAAGVPAPRRPHPTEAVQRRPVRPQAAPTTRDWLAAPATQAAPPVRVHRVTGEVLLARTDRRASRPMRLMSALLVNLVLLTALTAFIGLAVGPHTGEYRTLTMLTGSMRPHFPPGSVVVVTPQSVDDLRVGQVITFNAPTDGRVVTHRVVSIDRSGDKPVLETKGDANPGLDPWKATVNEPTVWRARFAIPLLGQAIISLRDPQVQLVLTKVLPGLLVAWLLWSVWRPGTADD